MGLQDATDPGPEWKQAGTALWRDVLNRAHQIQVWRTQIIVLATQDPSPRIMKDFRLKSQA